MGILEWNLLSRIHREFASKNKNLQSKLNYFEGILDEKNILKITKDYLLDQNLFKKSKNIIAKNN